MIEGAIEVKSTICHGFMRLKRNLFASYFILTITASRVQPHDVVHGPLWENSW